MNYGSPEDKRELAVRVLSALYSNYMGFASMDYARKKYVDEINPDPAPEFVEACWALYRAWADKQIGV